MACEIRHLRQMKGQIKEELSYAISAPRVLIIKLSLAMLRNLYHPESQAYVSFKQFLIHSPTLLNIDSMIKFACMLSKHFLSLIIESCTVVLR